MSAMSSERGSLGSFIDLGGAPLGTNSFGRLHSGAA
jgi:hypothetical protein